MGERLIHVWSKLSARQWEDAWRERLEGRFGTQLVITDIKGGKTVRLEVYCQEALEAEGLQKEFGGSVRSLRKQNWAALAPDLPPPLKVRDHFLVTAETDPAALDPLQQAHPERDLLSIPVELAFGTGGHATTATCLRFLVDYAREREKASQPWSMLDLGTGTGILAIAAAKLGAEPVLGCDFDPLAVAAAARNCERNGTPGIAIEERDVTKWQPRRQYDFIAANLFANILTAAMPRIEKTLAKDGLLVVSGILRDHEAEVRGSVKKAGLVWQDERRLGKWVTGRIAR
ncbi:MAG: 50S ribosomal protein L11 methyltransferase [Verrucomicrobiota bacterium]